MSWRKLGWLISVVLDLLCSCLDLLFLRVLQRLVLVGLDGITFYHLIILSLLDDPVSRLLLL